MSNRVVYLEENNPNINSDILLRKEYQLFKKNIQQVNKTLKIKDNDINKNIIPRFLLTEFYKNNRYLSLRSYQLFIKNYLNPNTPYSRLLLKWETGTGKTIGALSIALNFINFYQKEELLHEDKDKIGSVFIIGFTKQIFQNELLKFPEFGFLNRFELQKLGKLKQRAYSGSQQDIEKLKHFSLIIRKRLYNRKGNGYFKFYGYKELSNNLFINNSSKVGDKLNLSSLSENEIKEKIKKGDIVINKELLNSFKNSLIICDEIHNVYNSLEKNNWGIAIQTILNYHYSCRALLLSATPLNNSPTEIIDLLNLLLPRKLYPVLHKKDFFTKDNKFIDEKKALLSQYVKGRLSFIRDTNPRYFATKSIKGEYLPSMKNGLKFIRVPMSKFHYKTYTMTLKKNNNKLGQDSQYLLDFCLPSPEFNNPYSQMGLFKTSDIKTKLNGVSLKWKSKFNIYYDSKEESIMGESLSIKNNLGDISKKYTKMVESIHKKIKSSSGKIFIYHNIIHMSGTFFIREVLINNGIIGEFDSSSKNTLCVICGEPRHKHSKDQFVVIQGGSSNYVEYTIDNYVYLELYKNYYYELYLKESKENIEDTDCNVKLFDFIKWEDRNIILSEGFNPLMNEKNINHVIKFITSKNFVVQFHDTTNNIKNNTFIKKLKEKKYVSYQHDKYVYMYDKEKNTSFTKETLPEFFNKMKSYIIDVNKQNVECIKGGDKHYFQPTRFIIVHSNLERKQILKSLEKYNHVNNVNGNKYLILIGSQLIKESYSINSIRNMMIMSRPDNISTLIQIMGRSIRLGSHNYLPEEKRHVDIEIYTSCQPIKKGKSYVLGYEEEKYIQKIQTHKIIQDIEKLMHENAIDSSFNYDTIWNIDKNNIIEGIDILPYQSKTKNAIVPINKLNLNTFNAYYAKQEVDYLTYMIKRLFIETSPVWMYEHLLKAIRTPPFEVEIDTSLIEKNNFNIALNNLLYQKETSYIEPRVQSMIKNFQVDLIDKLNDPIEKILYIQGKEYVIVHKGNFYLMSILNKNNEVILDIETIYRQFEINKSKVLNITEYLKFDLNNNFNDKKIKFIKKWEKVSITNLELAMCDFGINFHKNIMEECVQYIFNIWTNPKQKKSEFHTFYLKFLYYYDIQKLIIWGHTANELIKKKLSKYMTPVNTKLLKNTILDKKIENIDKSSGLLNLLKTSINKSSQNWISTGMKDDFQQKLKKSLALFEGVYKKSNTFKKVPADILPVGHFLMNVPRFYVPDEGGWIDDSSYIEKVTSIKENPIVIGYDERSSTGISVKFKLRSPIQNIKQFKDTRSIEKGSICSTKSKLYLKEISDKLDIDLKDRKINVNDLCTKIRTKLIYYELKEQTKKKGEKLKYFYFLYQNRPETILS